MDISYVYLQTQVDRRGMDHLWKNKAHLPGDSEYFLHLRSEPMRQD